MKARGWIALLSALTCGLVVALLVELDAPQAPRRGTVSGATRGAAERLAPPEEPDEAVWPYEALEPEERAVVDRGRDVSGWEAVHRGFSAAAREEASLTEAGRADPR